MHIAAGFMHICLSVSPVSKYKVKCLLKFDKMQSIAIIIQ